MNRILILIALLTATAALLKPHPTSPSAEEVADLRLKIAELRKTVAQLDQPIGPKFIASQTAQLQNTAPEAPVTLTADPSEIRHLRDQITQLTENQQRLDKAIASTKKSARTAFTSPAEAASVALDSEAIFEHRVSALRALRAADQIPADVASTMLNLAPKLLDPKSREEIYSQFEDFEDPMVVSTLLTALQTDSDPKVRKKVGEILSSVRHLPDVTNGLASAVATDPDPEVREKVQSAMQGIRTGNGYGKGKVKRP
jgi:hypothetical protein